jgi:hypothetical protein
MNDSILYLPDMERVHAVDADDEGFSGGSGGGPALDFVNALLAALAQMAGLSPRRQADVAVAMRRSGLSASPETVQAALEQLRRDGCVERALHLTDGGILVSVTGRGIERLATTAYRHVVASMMSPGGG